jgi:hypothetical protein
MMLRAMGLFISFPSAMSSRANFTAAIIPAITATVEGRIASLEIMSAAPGARA